MLSAPSHLPTSKPAMLVRLQIQHLDRAIGDSEGVTETTKCLASRLLSFLLQFLQDEYEGDAGALSKSASLMDNAGPKVVRRSPRYSAATTGESRAVQPHLDTTISLHRPPAAPEAKPRWHDDVAGPPGRQHPAVPSNAQQHPRPKIPSRQRH